MNLLQQVSAIGIAIKGDTKAIAELMITAGVMNKNEAVSWHMQQIAKNKHDQYGK
jgi:hypothetical protein